MSEILVDIQNMTFKRDERVIYDDIILSIPAGKVTAIMGPSGIGKTTLLRLIGGQLVPESGKILFGEQNIPTLSRNALYEVRKRMSMLFQSGALFTEMSVYDNIAFPIREHTNLSEKLIEKMVLMKSTDKNRDKLERYKSNNVKISIPLSLIKYLNLILFQNMFII